MEDSLLNGEHFARKKAKDRVFNIILAVIALLIMSFFVFNLTVSVSVVSGQSMMKTLFDDETLLLEKSPKNIKRNDIVTITGLSKFTIIKRVMGLEGDKLVFKQREGGLVDLYRDIGEGYELLDESEYVSPSMTLIGWLDDRRDFRPEYKLAAVDVEIDDFDDYAITVGEGECFVLGDNRNDSSDSRKYGPGKLANIEGRLFYNVKKDSLLEIILRTIYRPKVEEQQASGSFID